ERISHFRPFKDFFRISVLNTVLVLITFLFIKPRDFIRTLFNPKKLAQLLNDHLFNSQESPRLKALSVGFGIFMGIIPIWGFQLVAAIFLAVLFKLNKPLVIIAANISIPPMIPLIIFLSYRMGALWLGDKAVVFTFSKNITLDSIKQNLLQYIYGSITLAIVAAVAFGLLTYFFAQITRKKRSAVAGTD
ncbi:MAG: DUF2062 domain-containing protein, partial [Ferruginibacter sp.]|nr:DUF2062 domain-containing protein [Ferruginibacter sp.]